MTAPNLAPGSNIANRFSVRALLGYGGSTATFRAVTAQGRDVALKLYSPALGQRPEVMQQLQRLVAETNSLPADLCVHVLEAGYDPATAAPFTSLDFMSAPSLAQLLMRRPMSPDEVAAMLRTLSAAIDAAHARELYHHALKPTNVFIDPSSPGHVKLMDFGPALARLVLPTAEGYASAAPWVAPEQVQVGAPPGAAADIFSLALVAFFALTGRSYWRSCQNAIEVPSWQRELLSHRVAASARGAELGISLNPALDAVFARALAHDPRERFRSASEFAAALSGFPNASLESATTLALPSPMPEPAAHVAGEGLGAPQGAPRPEPAMSASQDGAGVPPVAARMPSSPGMAAPAAPAIVAPTLTSAIAPPRSPWGRAAPVVVASVAIFLVGGAALAWFALGRNEKQSPTRVDASASSVGLSPTAVATTAPDAGNADPTAAPSATASAAHAAAPSEDDAGAEATPSAASDAGEEAQADAASEAEVLVTITCKPAPCDEVVVNRQPVKDVNAELRLAPGVYRVGVKRSGYFPRTEAVTVKAGEPVEKEFVLVAVPGPQTAPAAGAGTSKPCGKFLKRCK